MRWSNVFRGLLIGICDLIPGVSGGTVALVLGIYDELLASISGILSKHWRRHIRFLLPLGIGIGGALLFFSRAIAYLLEHHFAPTQMFFMGLIVGVLPMLLRRSDARRTFQAPHFVILTIAATAVAAMKFINPEAAVEPITELTTARAIGLFLAGAAGATAMLLPGISGSFVLLVLGAYPTAIFALATLHIPLIATIGAGVIAGLIVSSTLIRYVFNRYPTPTYAAIVGLIVGSVVVIYPGFASVGAFIMGASTFLAGFAIAVYFGQHET